MLFKIFDEIEKKHNTYTQHLLDALFISSQQMQFYLFLLL